MKIIRRDDREYIPASHEDQEHPEVWKKVLFQKDELVNGRIQMVNWAKLPVGNSFRAHYHEDMDEVFIMLNGTARIEVDSESAELHAGDTVVTPMKKIHKMTNIGDEDVQYIVIGISLQKNGKTIVTEQE